MEKLTKENIYIDLRGKSKEELTDLYNFLESVGEKHFRETLNDFLANIKYFETYIFHKDIWSLAPYVYILNKTKVTIEQLKEILQPMETFKPIAMKCTREQFEAIKPKLSKKKSLNIFMFNKEWNSFYLALFGDGSITNGLTHSGGGEIHEEWNEEIFLKACGIEVKKETLQEKEQRLLRDLEEVRKQIEDSKIKIGDWVYCKTNDCIFKYQFGRLEDDLEKIQDQELINKLNELIK